MIDKNIDAIIFDMDGVLIDTEKYLTRFWCQAAKEAGYEMTLEQAYSIRSLAGRYGALKLKEYFGEEFDYEAVRNRRKELMNAHLDKVGIEKKPYVLDSIKKLKCAGYKLAIATSTDSIRANKYLNEIGIKDFFDDIICTNMVEKGKPMPDIYLYACNRLGLEPKHCVAVEDSPNGILAAYRAHMQVIMIPDLTMATKEDKQLVCEVVNDMNELANLLC